MLADALSGLDYARYARWMRRITGADYDFAVCLPSVAQTAELSAAAILAAAACTVLSAAQRVLSTPVRRLRRHAVSVRGSLSLDDGTEEPIDASALRAAPERALRLLSLVVPLLAAAMLMRQLV